MTIYSPGYNWNTLQWVVWMPVNDRLQAIYGPFDDGQQALAFADFATELDALSGEPAAG